ncbi:MAG: enoyl-CoA hydratase/isomerase family protein [Chloroflexi bacterium]|nr:enoyl-CoA hydratase/isomerase family protein [Chloroflexota bacterium]
MAEQPLLYHQVDGIAILTLNNPERRNALSSPLLAALRERLDEIREDSTVRVVVLRSTGPVFSSGHDMRELVGRDAESYAAVFAASTGVMEAIRLLPQPVIAQVHGLATAAGCQLVASCDLAIAADTASFATPGVQTGCSAPPPVSLFPAPSGPRRPWRCC